MTDLAKQNWGKLAAGGGTLGLLTVLFLFLLQDYLETRTAHEARFQKIEDRIDKTREDLLEAITAHAMGPPHEPVGTQIGYLMEASKEQKTNTKELSLKVDTVLGALTRLEEAVRIMREK